MNPLYAVERSPIQSASPAYEVLGSGKMFLTDSSSTEQQIAQSALIDLTHLARVGFRGTDSATYLKQVGFESPDSPNTFVIQSDGSIVARLSTLEYMLLGSFKDFGERLAELERNWTMDHRANYLLPRQDSHACIQLTGDSIAFVMAKLCAVDLSAESFVVGQIAQTSVARINAIVMNVSDAQAPKFNILCDRASSLYLWNVLLDAIAEFDGKAIGIQGLL